MRIKHFSEKQLLAMSWWRPENPLSTKTALICDGAVRSGKTLCMGLGFVFWAFWQFQDADFAFCGKTIRSLKRNLMGTLLPVLQEEGFSCIYRETENLLRIRYEEGENRFYLFGGKDEGSAALIQGITLSGVFLDETALMPRSFVEQALARCSVDGSRFWFNCNPEYPQHWFYQEWIRKADEKNVLYLHFTMEDNPSLSPEIRERYEKLYSGPFYRRFILGEWAETRGLVYPFMKKEDFCQPVSSCRHYRISCDYGTVNPSSFGVWGEKDGVWYRLCEYYYDSRKEGSSRTDEEHYRGLEELLEREGIKEVECMVVDPSAASFIETILRHGRFRVLPAKNRVLDGIRQVSVALKEGRIRICKNCVDSIREFGLYRWAQGTTGDAPVKENDHAMDDIRYFVTTLLPMEEDMGAPVLSVERGG